MESITGQISPTGDRSRAIKYLHMLNTGGQHPDGGSGVIRVGRGSAPDPSHFLKRKIRVGSIHQNLNYDSSERALHRSEVPASSLAARVSKTEMKRADASRWRSETSTFIEFSERLSMQNFNLDPTEFTFNHRAEELPKSRPVLMDAFGTLKKVYFHTHFNRTAEMPVHSRLEGKTGWNLSTQVPYAERVRIQEANEAWHKRASSTATKKLTSSMVGPLGAGYEGLKAREDRRCRELRESTTAQKEQEQDPVLLEESRAAQLKWTASPRDKITRMEHISPVIVGADHGGQLVMNSPSKTPSNLEMRYLELVKESSKDLKTGTVDTKSRRSTKWCYGP